MELRWCSAVEQARLVATGELTAVELHAATRARIEDLDRSVGAVVGPLLEAPAVGVPILLKNAGQEVAGTHHWCGVAALRDAGSRSTTTTPLVPRLAAGGFSVIGHAACPELAAGVTTEPPGFAPTRNPWDPTLSAGGSSGGSAAAVAAGLVPLAHGSDATGSLRFPAALCGVATLKPTAGRVHGTPPAGQPADDAWCDMVLARHVEDLVAGFAALAHDAGPVPTVLGRLRVGLLDHDPELGLPIASDCADGARATAALLEAAGHLVDEAWPPALDHLWAPAAPSFGVVSDAVRAASVAWVGDRLGRPVQDGDLTPAVLEAAARARHRDPSEVVAARAAIEAAVTPHHDWWADHDVLVTPTTFVPGWPLDTDAGPAQVGTLAAPFSLSGQPALSLPLHTTPAGRPVGVQLVGRRGADEALLALAGALEGIADWRDRRPPDPPRP